jgi:hypothetical protein
LKKNLGDPIGGDVQSVTAPRCFNCVGDLTAEHLARRTKESVPIRYPVALFAELHQALSLWKFDSADRLNL